MPKTPPALNRRLFLAAGLSSASLVSLQKAMAIPAHNRTGTIMDVEHVVILTQENRAFDHYFGSLNGVQGFGDRFVAPVADDELRVSRSVFVQPNEHGGDPHLIAPFQLDTRNDFAMARHDGTPHGFSDGQAAWDNGRMSRWTLAKHNHAMGYFTREDIPFQYALADAFTISDAYHCAMHLCTNPNRLYIWTGTHDPLGKGHGPAIDNAYDSQGSDPYGHGGYTWTTYPERLLKAGVSFQIYQLMDDNFTDNPVVGFKTFRDALAKTEGRTPEQAALVERTMTTRGLDLLKSDVQAGKLPQVSWIVAPAAYSEHPNPSSPMQGAEYTAQVLDALTSNPEVWSKTVLLINFDENDGLFDHVPPPAPPARDKGVMLGASNVPCDDEYHTISQNADDAPYMDRPYGLGMRVPMYVVSPWSRGGYVAPEVFDHTSVIRFLEARFGVMEPNISAWRRAVCGDLTSCFDFKTPNDAPFLNALPKTRALSDRAGGLPQARPFPPESLTPPVQEQGLRRRRAVPYDTEVTLSGDGLTFVNRSRRAAVFHVYNMSLLGDVPWRYTVSGGTQLASQLPTRADGQFDLFILGPNGFHRRLTGKSATLSAQLSGVTLALANLTDRTISVQLNDLTYGQPSRTITLAGAGQTSVTLDQHQSHGWYDLQIACDRQVIRMAGHIENGQASFSDPAAHGMARLNVEDSETIFGRL